MSDSADFLWVGNHLALDFVNTLAAGPEGPLELLGSDADLWRWARASELGERVRPGQRSSVRLDPEVKRLRAAVHALFTARIDRKSPPASALEQLNDVLTVPRTPARLAYSGGRFRRPAEPLTTNEDLLWQLAESSAELLETAAVDRLRHCSGASCVLLFLDVSKSGLRRWCSMAGCGNRAKGRAHYKRLREDT